MGPYPWQTGALFDCAQDCESCCLGLWCPCITYASNGEGLNGKNTCAYISDCVLYATTCWIPFVTCFLGMTRREHLRSKYGLLEAPCDDCFVHLFCHACALCQEHREIQAIRSRKPYTRYGYTPPSTGNAHVHAPASRIASGYFPTQPLLDVGYSRPVVYRQQTPGSDAYTIPPTIPSLPKRDREITQLKPLPIYAYLLGSSVLGHFAFKRICNGNASRTT